MADLDAPRTDPTPITRRGLGELVVLAILAGCIGVAVLAMLLGVFTGDIGVATTILLIGTVGGLLVAVVASALHSKLGPADPQHLERHPRWYGYGPVGGAGGVIAIVGFVYT